MKQKKYRLLKDIKSPLLKANAGDVGVCQQYVGEYWFDNYRYYFSKTTVENNPEWFEEVNEEPSEDKRKKEIMKAYSDGAMFGFGQLGHILEQKFPQNTDPEKYFIENFNQ